MNYFRKFYLLIIISVRAFICHAQDASWMLGKWKGTNYAQASQIFSKTIAIDAVSGNHFTGTKTTEADDRFHSKIVTSFNGTLDGNHLGLEPGKVIFQQDAASGKWRDCSGCPISNQITIADKKILLKIDITGCEKGCNGSTTYARSLCDFDSVTQVYLVGRFGSSTDVAFSPCLTPPPPPPVAGDPDKEKADTKEQGSLAKRRQRQIDDSIKNEQNLARQKQQRITDSIKNAQNTARLKEQHIQDSIAREQAFAKQKQQHITDSIENDLSNARKKRQQLFDDSVKNAQSIARLAAQRLADSVKNATALAKKHQQEIDDSIKNLQNIARIREQKTQDSINNALAIARKKQQQLANDSIKNAKNLAKIREKERLDSTRFALIAQKKREQFIADSIARQQENVRIKQERNADSIKNAVALAKKTPPPPEPALPASAKDSIRLVNTNKAFKTRENVLLENYHFNSPDILIELFDNAQIDGDRVSVFHNGDLMVNNQMLQKEPITLKLHGDSAHRTHEFILVAENLGTIPPNTALMRITVGTQRYSLSVKTDMSTNAKLVLYYDGN